MREWKNLGIPWDLSLKMGGIWEFHAKPPWKTLRFWAIFPGMGNLEFFPFFFFFFQGEDGQEALSFEFQKIKYSYEIHGKKQFLPVAFPVEHPLGFYQNSRGFQEEQEIREAERKYGNNK